MTTSSELLRPAMQPPLGDRAALIEGLSVSLASPDLSLDTLWLTEAESRMAAYRSGEIDVVDAEQVFAALGKHV